MNVIEAARDLVAQIRKLPAHVQDAIRRDAADLAVDVCAELGIEVEGREDLALALSLAAALFSDEDVGEVRLALSRRD